LDELLIKFSQIFFVDINVYDLDGFLLATSRPEIFERGLISKQMNSSAYNELVFNKKALIIRKEQIGELSYSSVYIPFENKDNKVIAYVNLPYFTDDDNLQKNISNLLITTINIYVILFLLAIVLAFFISTNITRPLRMLQSKFKNVELGKKHQEISYKKDDEVGALVTEYNRMVAELEKSVKKLAESERENAWREMAKQIAHEIKNPLTPMKLSVQLLQRSWNDNKENFETRLNGVSNTLIEQIDTLSSIASEFSAFAKMPKAQDEEVNLSAKLQTVVQLFENTRDADIKIDLHGNNEVYILADKEQISRVFINIIKNGIQSIPEGVRGKIYVELTTYANYAKVTIEDNGSGIPDDRKGQLFKPSFTTKTTGMGMGLAIVKNIINSSNGEIWFESELGKGTKFFVEFPLLFKS
jgi:nitrogen fixation/metabolism regulation signal transduction histidine kinase